MGEKVPIRTGWDCFLCGCEVEVWTDANQQGCHCEEVKCECEEVPWWCWDGDWVKCPECDALGYISVDDCEAMFSYDEMDEHNTKCFHRFEKTSRKENVG